MAESDRSHPQSSSDESPHLTQQVVVKIDERLHGVAVESVREMLELPPLTPLPRVPAHVRGVMNLRGHILPVMDLRMVLGLPPLMEEVEELCHMLSQREQDHRNWLAELETAVEQNRKFTGQTNPHLCAFGKWFDQFEHPNRQIRIFVQRFDEPHRRIHALAEQANALVSEGKTEEARELIEHTKSTDLSEMIHLFASFQDMLRDTQREVAVLVEADDRQFAISVDDVVAVEWLTEKDNQYISAGGLAENELTNRIALRQNEKKDLVALLDPMRLLETIGALQIEDAMASCAS